MRIKKTDAAKPGALAGPPSKSALAGPPGKSALAGPPGKLAAPARPLGGLRPPPAGAKRLIAPPSRNVSVNVSRIKAEELSLSSIMPNESRDDLMISDFNLSVASEIPVGPSSPTSLVPPEEEKASPPTPTINEHIERCMQKLEVGELPESLEALEAALKMLIV